MSKVVQKEKIISSKVGETISYPFHSLGFDRFRTRSSLESAWRTQSSHHHILKYRIVRHRDHIHKNFSFLIWKEKEKRKREVRKGREGKEKMIWIFFSNFRFRDSFFQLVYTTPIMNPYNYVVEFFFQNLKSIVLINQNGSTFHEISWDFQ